MDFNCPSSQITTDTKSRLKKGYGDFCFYRLISVTIKTLDFVYFTVFLYLSFFFKIIIINVWGQEWFAIAMQSCSYTMSHCNAPIIQKFDQLEFNDG